MLLSRPFPRGAPEAAAPGLALLLVLPIGLSDGGYYGRSTTALTVALAALAALAFLHPVGRPHRGALRATALALALLTCWVVISSLWAHDGAGVETETRRCVLYTVALVAVAMVARRGQRVFLLSLVAAITALAAVAVSMRVVSGVPLDPFYGSLLAEPVGYPNAIGVLAALAVVLAIGLGQQASMSAARLLRGAAAFLILVLGLTGSRGAALALCVGIAAVLALSERSGRRRIVADAAAALAVGCAAWGLVFGAGGHPLPLAIVAFGAAAIAAALPLSGRRTTGVLAAGLAVAAALVLAIHPPQTTSSYRSAYWKVALAEARGHPLLGSGAGSFYLTWRQHRTVEASVRDAHSLYVETLSELGPVGLALVLVVIVVPLGAAVGRRGDPVAATAAGAFAVFAVHAGVDWDWEMPVVTLAALGCAAVLLVSDAHPATDESARRRRTACPA